MSGRTINLFLVDGSPTGLRFAEIGLSTIKAIVVPRASLQSFAKRYEASRTGVYLLLGPDATENSKLRLYVGEGDSIITRIKKHDDEKDFWTDAVVLISKDENLTKSHVRYLEAQFIQDARDAKRVIIDNGTTPPIDGKLPEPAVAEMNEFTNQAKLLIATLGFGIFQSSKITATAQQPADTTSETTFKYSGGDFDAVLDLDSQNGKFVVRSGSKARVSENDSLTDTYKNLRAQLQTDGILVRNGASFDFTDSVEFSSISAAAQVVSGQTINGRIAWKTEGDKTYKDWQDESIVSDVDESGGDSPVVERETPQLDNGQIVVEPAPVTAENAAFKIGE